MTDRFCINCRFFQNNKDNTPTCGRYFTLSIGPIYGLEKHFDTCEYVRNPGGKCGPEGFGWSRHKVSTKVLRKIKSLFKHKDK